MSQSQVHPARASLDAVPAELDACWQKLGVYGDRTCPELQKVIHCRNCSVYSNAGIALLNRPLPEHYRRERTEHFAREQKLRMPARRSAIVFRIGAEWLALATQAFLEVAEVRAIHSLPHRRGGLVLGLVNVRGELLICIALSRLLGLENVTPEKQPGIAQSRLMVVEWEGHRLAYPVNEIHGIQRFQPEDLKSLPTTVAKSNACFTQGLLHWQERTVGLLDAPRLFAALNRSLA
jgi:chemotaxis-related protein WspD